MGQSVLAVRPTDLESQIGSETRIEYGRQGSLALDLSLAQQHILVLAGSVCAAETLTSILLPVVRARLRRLMAGLDHHAIEDCVEDAILIYLRSPALFQPDRGSLSAWITTIALNKARDFRRRDRRLSERLAHSRAELAGLWAPAIDDACLSLPVLDGAALMVVAYTEAERRFMELRLKGVRSSEVLARALGVVDGKKSEARAEVHRTWARLRARLQRLKRAADFLLCVACVIPIQRGEVGPVSVLRLAESGVHAIERTRV